MQQEEECIHLLTIQTCVICNKREANEAKQRLANKKRFLQLLKAGVIKLDDKKSDSSYSYTRVTDSNPNVYNTHSLNLEDDQNRFNSKIR